MGFALMRHRAVAGRRAPHSAPAWTPLDPSSHPAPSRSHGRASAVWPMTRSGAEGLHVPESPCPAGSTCPPVLGTVGGG